MRKDRPVLFSGRPWYRQAAEARAPRVPGSVRGLEPRKTRLGVGVCATGPGCTAFLGSIPKGRRRPVVAALVSRWHGRSKSSWKQRRERSGAVSAFTMSRVLIY